MTLSRKACDALLQRVEIAGRGRKRGDRRAQLLDLTAQVVEPVDSFREELQVAAHRREVVDPVPQPVELVAQRIGLLARRRFGEVGGEPVDVGVDSVGEPREALVERVEIAGRGRQHGDGGAQLLDLTAQVVEAVDALGQKLEVARRGRKLLDPVLE